jgi:hypothetical protein
MTMKSCLVAVAGALSLSTAPAGAHHSIATVYDGTKSVRVEGVITRVEFVNPHPLLTIDVMDAGGAVQSWRLEMDNRSELAAVGMTNQTLKPGDRVVASGSPSRSQPRSLYLLKLDRPSDGFGYEQVGSSPRIRPPSR